MEIQAKNIVIAFIICLVSGGLFITMANFIGSGKIESFDLPIIQFVQGFEAPWLTTVFKTFTWIGSAKAVVPITLIICFLLFFIYQRRQQAVLFAFAIVGTITLNESLKAFYKRERPEIYRIMDAGGYSFPSGHTMMAFSLYGMIAYIAWHAIKTTKGRIAFILFLALMSFMIAVSRIYVGVHYPSDIVGGIAMSALWVTIVITIYSTTRASERSKRSGAN